MRPDMRVDASERATHHGWMRWTWLVVGVALAMGCGDDDTTPADDGAATGGTSGADGSSESSSSGSSETAVAETEESDTFADECFDDRDCPGTEICDQPSLYENTCVPSGECSSKVECPPGFECFAGSHHSSNGECVPEDPSTSDDSGSSDSGSSESSTGTDSSSTG